MTKIAFDEPSEGAVIDPKPALTVLNWAGTGILAHQLSPPPTIPFGLAPPLYSIGDSQVATISVGLNNSAVQAVAPKAIAVNAFSSVTNAATITGVNIPPPLPPAPPSPPTPATHGPTTPPAPPAGYGVLGYAAGNATAGVVGITPGNGSGTVGVAGGDGVVGFGGSNGVRGESLAGPGVRGHSYAGPGMIAASDQAEGLLASAVAANRPAVSGTNNSASGFGVVGSSDSGIGVQGLTSSGVGVEARSARGIAVHAEAVVGTGIDVASDFGGPAIKARAFGGTVVDAAGFGDYIVNAYGGGCAVKGVSLAGPIASKPEQGCGIFGFGIAHIGVYGGSLTGVGILGETSPAGAYAGVFKGNVWIEGFLFKSASLFSIEHPLAPKRRRLNHAAVEAPEYKTFYDGITTLDSRGSARIRMPKWFDALNGQIRYQLTPIGQSMPHLHVAAELRGRVFAIAGGRPRGKVSWQITGVRRDRWARENPLRVEQSKSDFASIPTAVELKALARRAEQDADQAKSDVKRKRRDASREKPAPKTTATRPRKSQPFNERDAYLRNAEKTVRKLMAAAAKAHPEA